MGHLAGDHDDAHRVRRITDASRNQLHRANADRRDVIGAGIVARRARLAAVHAIDTYRDLTESKSSRVANDSRDGAGRADWCLRQAGCGPRNERQTEECSERRVRHEVTRMDHRSGYDTARRRAIGCRMYGLCPRRTNPPQPFSFASSTSITETFARSMDSTCPSHPANASVCSAPMAPARPRRSRSARVCCRPIQATSSCSDCVGTKTRRSFASVLAFNFRKRSSPRN